MRLASVPSAVPAAANPISIQSRQRRRRRSIEIGLTPLAVVAAGCLLLLMSIHVRGAAASTVMRRLQTGARRGAAAFVVAPSSSSFSSSRWIQQSQHRRPCQHPSIPPPAAEIAVAAQQRRAFTTAGPPPPAASTLADAHVTTTPTTAVPPPTVQEMDNMRIASYFPLDTKDNTTAFFHVLPFPPNNPNPSWADIAAQALNLPLERAEKLHEIGAIYAKRGGKLRRTRNLVEGGDDWGRFRREPEGPVEGELVRVHLFPRRFPRCYGTDYRRRIAYEDEDLLVVDKPAGCPCSLHVSNALEVLDIAASAQLGHDLIRMNRLDTVTTGLVTLAKTPKGATAFWEELRRDRVGKRYRALLTHKPLALGLHEHFMPGKIIHRRPAPRAVGRRQLEGWKICQSRVLSCSGPLRLPWVDPARPDEEYYEVEVELITGRTHQLRATFAAEGAPIVHDTMYTPLAGFFLDDEDDPAIQAIYPICVEPSAPTGIGLQCSALTFLGRTVEAGTPWWRQQTQQQGGCGN